MRRLLPWALLLLTGSAVLAEDALDPVQLIGLGPGEAMRLLGAPEALYTERGEEQRQDDVVFYYPQHLYLFWFEDRVWQVRLDGRYEGEAFGLHMGDGRERVLALMGRPLRELPDSLVYQLPDRGYPMRLRLFFGDGELLADLYCYRGDL
jgi:hypothetical protein